MVSRAGASGRTAGSLQSSLSPLPAVAVQFFPVSFSPCVLPGFLLLLEEEHLEGPQTLGCMVQCHSKVGYGVFHVAAFPGVAGMGWDLGVQKGPDKLYDPK